MGGVALPSFSLTPSGPSVSTSRAYRRLSSLRLNLFSERSTSVSQPHTGQSTVRLTRVWQLTGLLLRSSPLANLAQPGCALQRLALRKKVGCDIAVEGC